LNTTLNKLPAWEPTGNLSKMLEPRHRVLAEFMGGCSPDPATRTIATTALVLSLWQVAGWRMTHRPPSMLLLATESTPDPIDRMADTIASYRGRKGPAEKGVGQLVGATPSQADTAMRLAVMRRQQLGKPGALNAAGIAQQVQRFRTARTTAHGTGPTRGYANAWDEQLGLITDEDNQVILRLDAPRDHAAFRRDVLEDHERLRDPQGIGGMLQMVRKSISISGSLTFDLWDARLAHRIVELGLPILHLPHLAGDPLECNHPALYVLALDITRGLFGVTAEPHFPPKDWCRQYERFLRERLHLLHGDYEFSVLRVVRELGPVCQAIARSSATEGATAEQVQALAADLYCNALRGITLGVAALAWHCLGFDCGCEREVALELLHHLRDQGDLTRREIQRRFPAFSAEQRDRVLERLAAEGLVELKDKKVAAMTMEGFVKALHARAELPMAVPIWPAVAGAQS